MRVLELSDREEAAAYAAHLFRRWGAEVIKVESPGRPACLPAADIAVNGGKRRLTLDARDPAQRAAIAALAESADVVLTDHDVRELDAANLLELGVGSNATRVSITPFGLDGPYRDMPATPATLLALGGYTWLMGDPGRAPLTMPGNYVAYQAGTYAYIGALATLLGGGGGDGLIEVSMLECLASLHQFTDTLLYDSGITRGRHGNRWENLCPTTLLPCADGWYGVNILQTFWFNFAHMIGRPEMAAEGPWALNAGRMADIDSVEEATRNALWDTPRREIFRNGQESWRVPVGFAASLQEVLDDPHLAERDFWREVTTPAGTVRVPGSPYRFVGEQPPPEAAPLPREGPAAARWTAPAEAKPTSGRDRARPLAGVRVIDLTRIWSGPLSTRILGDLGADVIKIEASTGRGATFPGDFRPRPWNLQGLFNKLSRNKRSISLDLKAPEGRAIFLDLVRGADVVIENFSARAMPGLGLSYEEMRAVNARIVYLSMPAFGMRGPYRDYVGLGPSIEPITGMTALMGYSDAEPRVTSKALTDAIAGTTAASAVINALWRRGATGTGVLIDLSQHEAGVGFLAEAFIERQLSSEEPRRAGNAHRTFAPHGVYRCSGEDEWIALAARDDTEWAALCGVLGLDVGGAHATAAGRLAGRAGVDARIEAASAVRDKLSLMSALAAAGIPAGVVQRSTEYLRDPHLAARGYFVDLAHPEAGTTAWDGSPLRFEGDRGHQHWFAAPCLGADNRSVLEDLLGLDSERLDALYADGVLAESPPAVG